MTTHASYSGNSYIAEERQYKYKSLQKEIFLIPQNIHIYLFPLLCCTHQQPINQLIS